MKTLSPSNRNAILIGVAVIICAVVALRWSQSSPSSIQSSSSTSTASSVPVFTSARFQSGEVMGALGPEWTFLRQTDLTDQKSDSTLAGLKPVRQTVAKLVGKPTSYMFTEYTILNATAFEESLGSNQVQQKTINNRDGYIIPIASITGGTGFAIVGNNSVLVIQDANTATLPDDLGPEIQSFITAANVL